MKRSVDWHKIAYQIARFVAMITLGILMPFRAIGRKNVPEGAAIVCANHSSWADPVLLAFAVPGKYHMRIMAKKELFVKRLPRWFFNAIGTFPVDRSTADMESMRTSILTLKAGKKLALFPEGTRVADDNAVSPKAGAIRMAEKTGAPLVPVYVPRKKRYFHRTSIIIGEPFVIEKAAVKRTHEDYERLADELMQRIQSLQNIPG